METLARFLLMTCRTDQVKSTPRHRAKADGQKNELNLKGSGTQRVAPVSQMTSSEGSVSVYRRKMRTSLPKEDTLPGSGL